MGGGLRRGALPVLGVVAAAILGPLGTPAVAGGGGDTDLGSTSTSTGTTTGPGSVTVHAETTVTGPAGPGGTRSTRVSIPCIVAPAPPPDPDPHKGDAGAWKYVACGTDDMGLYSSLQTLGAGVPVVGGVLDVIGQVLLAEKFRQWVPDKAQPVYPVDPQQVSQAALDTAQVPDAQIHTNPAQGAGSVVGLPTWLWVELPYETVTASATAGNVTASVTARLQSVTWTLGDGSRLVCTGSGTPYDPSTYGDRLHSPSGCEHDYSRASSAAPGAAYPVTADVTWTLSGNVPPANGFPVLRSRLAATTLRVDEVQTVLSATPAARPADPRP